MNDAHHRDSEVAVNVNAVKKFYANLSKGDVPGVLQALDPQIKWTEARGFPYFGGTWTGPNAVLDNLLARIPEDWGGFTVSARGYVAEGSNVVVLGEYAGTYKKTGKYMHADFVHLWTAENGKLKGFVQHTDTLMVREAMH